MIDELRELIEITGASGVADAMSTVRSLMLMAKYRQEHLDKGSADYYANAHVFVEETLFYSGAALRAHFAMMHEYERVKALAERSAVPAYPPTESA